MAATGRSRSVTPIWQLHELLQGQVGLFEDMGERGALDWAMPWHCELQNLGAGVLLEPNMAAPLPNHDPRAGPWWGAGSSVPVADDRPAQPGSHKGDGQDGRVSWPVWGAAQYGRGWLDNSCIQATFC